MRKYLTSALLFVALVGCRAIPTAANFHTPDGGEDASEDATIAADTEGTDAVTPGDVAVDAVDAADVVDVADVQDVADAQDAADTDDAADVQDAADAEDAVDTVDADDAVSDVVDAVDAVADVSVDVADVPDVPDVTAQDVAEDVPADVTGDAAADVDVAPDVQPDVFVDPCTGKNCDDGNACTSDSCADGACQWAQLPDWTECGEGMVCDGQGMCADVKIAKGMAYIPAATFWMGCNAVKDVNCSTFANESPQHKVNLSGYYMDVTEVTVAAYKACVDLGVCTEPGEVSPKQYATYPGLPNNPVNNVTWWQARQYCTWKGAAFDLPTEAQWEMAARGSCEKNGSSGSDPACAAAMRTYPWGENAPSASYVVVSLTSTAAVGSVPGGDSPYGLHDMAGNVYEFTRDLLDTSFYSSSPANDPLNSTAGNVQSIRGGAIGNDKLPLRSSSRDGISASLFGFNLGFRCMRAYTAPASLCANVTCPSIPCATNACDAATGKCVATALTDGTACEDGSACTSNDQCVGGKCFGGSATNCDDANACTNDACAPVSGCSHSANDANTCSDGDACTADACVQGACKATAIDADKDGYGPGAACGGDCNDNNAAVNPGATETCNGIDDDCTGVTDEPGAANCTTYFQDADQDGYGSSANLCLCAKSDNYTATNSSDCNDAAKAINPKALETCDGIDNDCDGTTDPPNADGCTNWYVDKDGDGYGTYQAPAKCLCGALSGYAAVGGDCDDTSSGVHPGAVEVCNGKDDDCDGVKDPKDSGGCTNYFLDQDSDGYGTALSQCLCTAGGGFTAVLSSDCNDSNAAVKPGATEVCNGIDDNCNGQIDEGVGSTYYQDLDGDGYGSNSTTTACSKPSGYVTLNGDCNDVSAGIHPGAAELCNGIDDTCNGQSDEGLATSTYYQDADGDGYGNIGVSQKACAAPPQYVASPSDCDDTHASVNPGAAEVCGDSLDNNCNGQTDEGCVACTPTLVNGFNTSTGWANASGNWNLGTAFTPTEGAKCIYFGGTSGYLSSTAADAVTVTFVVPSNGPYLTLDYVFDNLASGTSTPDTTLKVAFTFNGVTQQVGPSATYQGTGVKQVKWAIPQAKVGTTATVVITPTANANGVFLSGIMVDNLRTTCN